MIVHLTVQPFKWKVSMGIVVYNVKKITDLHYNLLNYICAFKWVGLPNDIIE